MRPQGSHFPQGARIFNNPFPDFRSRSRGARLPQNSRRIATAVHFKAPTRPFQGASPASHSQPRRPAYL